MNVLDVCILFEESGLEVHQQTIRKWCRTGVLNARKDSRYDGYVIERSSVELLIEKKLKVKHKRQIVFQKGYQKGFDEAKKLYRSSDLLQEKKSNDKE